ncbi:CBS domain-containing protein CBSX5 [Ricinus communis]|uniref:CBS domain-containing protein n=1 Tax=Ricinus communis TaxID=3988 RepID=B9SRF5_RICCO|nr:CBS domain-containing protein CBSX5 [Ricinus communis]EEF33829.1 conserved hypothetical protein [Ricinus communis]|eukprot:XP_002528574.1 CBS domain-containing protein CBSX5 [Ricinus communis]
MAVSLFAHEVSDLCLGKPALRSLPVTATVAEALSALKNSDDSFLSVWNCDHITKRNSGFNCDREDRDECKCVGKVSIVDVICYLCQDKNLVSPSDALKDPVSVLLPKIPGLVMHVEPSSSLVEAIDLILQGAQNLVVPIKTRLSSSNSRRKQQQKLSATSTGLTTIHKGREFCWLAQEDIIRFFLSSIGLFSPVPALSIDSLGIITTDIITIDYNSPASATLGAINRALATQTSVAVVDGDEGILIGELSPFTLACCDETVAAAITTLSSGDLMAYIDCGGPPEDLVRVVMARLKHRGLEAMLQEFTNSTTSLVSFSTLSSSSSDEESTTTLHRSGKYSRSKSYSARMVRRAEAIVCHPKSSLVAVMIQAIAHRVNYVWVIEEDCSLVGIVTFCNMLKVFREHLEAMA